MQVVAPTLGDLGAVRRRFADPEDEALYLDLVKRLMAVQIGPYAGFGPFAVFNERVATDLATRAVTQAVKIKATVRAEASKAVAPYFIGAGALGVLGAFLGIIAIARR